MSLNKKSVDDINVKGLRVLCRCDFNVPLKDGKITDENRLVAALPTIKKLIADGGKVILCSHLGKVKTEEDKLTKTLAPVAVRLSELLGQEVKFVADPEVVGPNARAAVEAMKDGEVILLENTRFRPEETKNGLARSVLQIHATRRAVRAKLLLEEVLTLVFGALLDVHADGQATLIELNVDIILSDAGQIGLDLITIALVLDINGERLGSNRVVCKIGHIIKQIEQRASRRTNAKNRTIRNHACHVYHSF